MGKTQKEILEELAKMSKDEHVLRYDGAEAHKEKHGDEYYPIPDELLHEQIWRVIELMPEKGRKFFRDVIDGPGDVAEWIKRMQEDNARRKILTWIIGGAKSMGTTPEMKEVIEKKEHKWWEWEKENVNGPDEIRINPTTGKITRFGENII